MRTIQNIILQHLKEGRAIRLEYIFADNITRANYADFLWPTKSVRFRCHFMFHTDRVFNGFRTGRKRLTIHSDYPGDGHCCRCNYEKKCFDSTAAES